MVCYDLFVVKFLYESLAYAFTSLSRTVSCQTVLGSRALKERQVAILP